jgi:hypothetical protein
MALKLAPRERLELCAGRRCVFAVQQQVWNVTVSAGVAPDVLVAVVHVALVREPVIRAEGNGPLARRRGPSPMADGLAVGLAAADRDELVVVTTAADPPSPADRERFATALIEGVQRAQLLGSGVDWLPQPRARQRTAPAGGVSVASTELLPPRIGQVKSKGQPCSGTMPSSKRAGTR